MSMFNDISCEGKDNKQQCLRERRLRETVCKKDLELVNGLSLDQVPEKKWYPSENSPHGEWDRIAEDMLLEFAKSGHPIFRANDTFVQRKIKK